MAAFEINPADAKSSDRRSPPIGHSIEKHPIRDGDCPRIELLWPVAVDERPLDWVARHLERCSSCRRRTEGLAHEIAGSRSLIASGHSGDGVVPLERGSSTEGVESNESPGSATQPLAVIGKYFVLEILCESGQATVFRGLHPSLLIDVVIKLAHQPMSDDELGRAQLVAEAKALAEIVHPHLARLYDLDFHEHRPFLVLEYVRGRDLRHYRESTAIPPSRIALLVAQIARALAAAHERGILHLDLKPENILVTPQGEPVLIDFGLSFLSASGTGRSRDEGYIAGTPQYMAPEQIHQGCEPLTQRTDVYGLGGILYYLCVGHDPFPVIHNEGVWERPAVPDWWTLDRAMVPSRLKSICRKALAADPEMRYASAEEFAQTLEDATQRWNQPAARRRIAAALFLLGAACLIAGLLFPQNRPSQLPSISMKVIRSGREIPLVDSVPLRSDDRIRVEGNVDSSPYIAAFALSDVEAPRWLGPLRRTVDRSATRIAFPAFGGTIPLYGKCGTMLVLVVSRDDQPISRQDVVTLPAPDSRLSSVPVPAVAVFDRKQCDLHVKAGTCLSDAHQAEIRRQIQSFQTRLAEQFDDYAGILLVAPASARND